MKKLFLIVAICGMQTSLFAAPGCMDNSYRLTQHNDYKDYNYVECNCPCEKRYKIIDRKSTCSKCGHYRDPRYSAMLMERGFVSCPKAFSNFACTGRAACAQICQ